MQNTKGLQKPVLPAYWPKTGNPLWANRVSLGQNRYKVFLNDYSHIMT